MGVGAIALFTMQAVFGVAFRRTVSVTALAIAALLLLHGFVAAQSLQHAVIRTWRLEQGLPQNFVTAIAQTPDGFLWVGTYRGLARFDGVQFHSYDNDPPALRRRITGIVLDREGALWVGTVGGLVLADRGQMRLLVPSAAADGASTLRMSGDGHGVLFLNGTELWRATKDGRTHRVDVPAAAKNFKSYFEDAQGSLWFAAGDAVIVATKSHSVRAIPIENILRLYQAPNGEVFAEDGHHIWKYLAAANRFAPAVEKGPEEVVALLKDREHRLWIASGGLEGITMVSQDGAQQRLDARNGLASDDARTMFQDASGDIWVGTIAGLQQIHFPLFRAYSADDGLATSPNEYDSVFAAVDGSIWTGTLESGVARFTSGRWTVFGKAQGVRSGQVRGFADGDSAWPVISIADYGIFAFGEGRYRTVAGVPAGYLTSPVRTADGDLWFIVPGHGVFQWHAGQAMEISPGQNKVAVESLQTAVDGSLWAAAADGAWRFSEGRWSQVARSTSAVYSICFAAQGYLLGTQSGIAFAPRPADGRVSQARALPIPGWDGVQIFHVMLSSTGDLWTTSTRGIAVLRRAQFEQLLLGHADPVSPILLTSDDGLRTRSVLPLAQVVAAHAKDGTLWFATASGPVSTSGELPPTAAPKAVITDVMVDDRRAAADETVIEPGRHRLAFSFTAPVFIAPEEVMFRYRLLGYDSGWQLAGAQRSASYTNLPPGHYRFTVQAIARDGTPGPVSAGATVVQQPFLWQTRWFLALAAVCVVTAIVFLTRIRMTRQAEKLSMRFHERSTERERIAAQIHDSFVQDLTGAVLQMELLGYQLGKESPEARTVLDSLTSRMRLAIARSRDIVMNLHTMAAADQNLAELLQHLDADFRLNPEPSYRVILEGECPRLHPLVRDELYRICREAVANAFRHSQAASIVVTIGCRGSMLHIQIQDDGVGMEESLRTLGREGHFGVPGMYAYASRIHAQVSIGAGEAGGVRVVVSLRLDRKNRMWSKDRVAQWRQKIAGRTLDHVGDQGGRDRDAG